MKNSALPIALYGERCNPVRKRQKLSIIRQAIDGTKANGVKIAISIQNIPIFNQLTTPDQTPNHVPYPST